MRNSGTKQIRSFETGATRDALGDKLVYEAFLSPLVLRRYAEYMHTHRKQPDGAMRPGDNWQLGISIDTYRDSLVRHVMDAWYEWRKGGPIEGAFEDLLCAIIFNASGYLFELLKDKK